MIPTQAIEKAIEGGWISLDPETDAKNWQKTALSRSFWQSLGKATGNDSKNLYVYTSFTNNKEVEGWWQWAMHRFLDTLILTGGDTEAFWEELLSPSRQKARP